MCSKLAATFPHFLISLQGTRQSTKFAKRKRKRHSLAKKYERLSSKTPSTSTRDVVAVQLQRALSRAYQIDQNEIEDGMMGPALRKTHVHKEQLDVIDQLKRIKTASKPDSSDDRVTFTSTFYLSDT